MYNIPETRLVYTYLYISRFLSEKKNKNYLVYHKHD